MTETSASEEQVLRHLRSALRRLLEQPSLITKLKSTEEAKEAMEELRISSEEMRTTLINILDDLRETPSPAGASSPALKSGEDEELDRARDFFDSAFSQLRSAYRKSMAMSVTMFLIGVGFLVLAAAQAVREPESVATTAVLGGIGIVQIVALFYRNPLADIARTVSNAQQAKIALTSYVISLGFLRDSIGLGSANEGHVKLLMEVTEKALVQLQTFAEDHPVVHGGEAG